MNTTVKTEAFIEHTATDARLLAASIGGRWMPPDRREWYLDRLAMLAEQIITARMFIAQERAKCQG